MISTASTSRHAIRRAILVSSRPFGRQRLAKSSSSASARGFVSSAGQSGGGINHHTHRAPIIGAIASVLAVGTAASFVDEKQSNDRHRQTSYVSQMAARIPTSGDVLSVGKITKEPATGLAFPALCNGMTLAGVGVRIKYVFVKVYAVGTYLDPIAMAAVKNSSPDQIEKALLDPTYPRTIRIVMNRGLSVDKFIAAIVEAIEPRLNGQNLETLDEFKKLFPPVDLVEGAEVEMTIRGDMLLLKNATGGVGTIKSQAFTEAMCDVYYGDDAVSPTMKEDVLAGIKNL